MAEPTRVTGIAVQAAGAAIRPFTDLARDRAVRAYLEQLIAAAEQRLLIEAARAR